MDKLEKNDISIRVADAARRAWEEGSEFRSRRQRYKRFTYGDQWSDIVTQPDGERMTTGMEARRHGKDPMTNNLIRRMVKCVVGRFRMWLESAEDSGGSETGGRKLDGITYHKYRESLSLDEMDSRALEEFLISGMAIQRVSDETGHVRDGMRVDNVSPAKFFVNSHCDPRGDDIELIGMLHDMSISEAVMRFCHGSRDRAMAIREHFGRMERNYNGTPLGWSNIDGQAFDRSNERCRCRVIEVWTLESREMVKWHDRASNRCGVMSVGAARKIDAENRSRLENGAGVIESVLTHSTVWHCRWLTADGTVLEEYDSRYRHHGHPFVVKMYPLIDGEVHSLVEDVIDQQIYVNRLITLMEKVMSNSAKGVLLFPKWQKSPNMDWETLASIWSSPDGVIPYEAVEGMPEPKQLITNGSDFGARELLSLELQMLEDVSGVSNALLGRSSGGGNVGYERYESEVRNASVAINDLLLSFVHFCKERNRKMEEAGVMGG